MRITPSIPLALPVDKVAPTELMRTYSYLLDKGGVPYREDETWLYVGDTNVYNRWWLFVSIVTLQTVPALEKILPVLQRCGAPFRMIKGELHQYRLNAGVYGTTEVGKVLTIMPRSEETAVTLTEQLVQLCHGLKGPEVPAALRLSDIVYAAFAQISYTDEQMPRERLQLIVPHKSRVPFQSAPGHHATKQGVLLDRRYVFVGKPIRRSAKGFIQKAIDIKGFRFEPCLIKQGKPNALDDHLGRQMKDRLLWQQRVIDDLAPYVPTAKCRRFLELGEYSYLVLEYLEGKSMGDQVTDILRGRSWHELTLGEKRALLQLFYRAVILVGSIHEQGYVHRDLTDTNFISTRSGQLNILDFELSFHLESASPSPPFLLGTRGYMAPEQLQFALPTPKEDIYSLGALLGFVLTGVQPCDLFGYPAENTEQKVHELLLEDALERLLITCLADDPGQRPAITTMLNELNHLLHETK